jgi:hypothetical protein
MNVSPALLNAIRLALQNDFATAADIATIEGDIAAIEIAIDALQNFDASLTDPYAAQLIPLPRGYFAGFALSNNLTDPNNDIDVTTGTCRNSTNTTNIVLAAARTKRLDAAWAVGDGTGGLDTGSKAANTSYYLHVIRRADTGVVDVLFSTSPTSPTLPANYGTFRCIGFVRTDGSGNIRPGRWAGYDFYYTAYVRDISTTVTSAAEAKHTLVSVPAIEGVYALASVTCFHASTTQAVRVAPGFQTASTLGTAIMIFGATSAGATIPCELMVDSQARISAIGSTTAITFVVDIRGHRFVP